jgi:hypothetical protein
MSTPGPGSQAWPRYFERFLIVRNASVPILIATGVRARDLRTFKTKDRDGRDRWLGAEGTRD